MGRHLVPELPHSDEAEKAILAAILVSNELLPRVETQLRTDELFRETSRLVYAAMQRLGLDRAPIDLITLQGELSRIGQLDRRGGPARLAKLLDGAHKSANVSHYVQVVKEKARRRAIMATTEKLLIAAGNGMDEEGLQALLAEIQIVSVEAAPLWTPSSLEGVANQQAGDVRYVVEGLIPAGDTTVIGATWKSGKSLAAYRLILDVMSGKPAFGALEVPEPLPVAVFQLEMPAREDDRRLRRLALGSGIPLEHLPRLASEGHLLFFNRPPMNLTTPEGAARFCRVVRACGARFIVLDSLIAAFAGADLNDNSTVRAMFTRAFAPLTSEGITVLALHHHRKPQNGSKRSPDDKSALLGAQAFGAAAGRVYKLDRLGKEDDPDTDKSRFRLKLSLTGSWTPEKAEDLILSVHDTEEGGTMVTLLTEAEQIRRGGTTAMQRAAITLARLVTASAGIERKAALEEIQAMGSVSASTAKGALWYAQSKGWVDAVHPEGRRNNIAVLMPGPNATELP